MATASAAARGSANLIADNAVGKSRQTSRQNNGVMRAAHSIWEHKTAQHLAGITGVSQRTAERWLSGDCAISAVALSRLLRSEFGMGFLVALMVGAQPRWWRLVRKASRVGEMRRQQQKLQEAIDEIATLDDDLARAEASLVYGDEDFLGPHVEALRQTRRR